MMARCAFIAAVLTASTTRAAPPSRSAQKAPNSQTDWNPPCTSVVGLLPFSAQRRPILPFCPTRLSSCTQDFDMLRFGMVALDLGQSLRERLLERRLGDRVGLMVLRSADQWHKVHRMEPCARVRGLCQYPIGPSPNPRCDEP